MANKEKTILNFSQKNFPKYIFVNIKGDFFMSTDNEKDYFCIKADLEAQNLKYFVYVKESSK